ncbi:unnamed protein product, partial [Candidula unifasciata]
MEEKLSTRMAKTLTESYSMGSGNERVTLEWDMMQHELECCGVKGNVTGGRSWFIWQSSNWFKKQNPVIMYVPESCCKKNDFLFNCGISKNMTDEEAKRNYTSFTQEHSALFTTGCLDKIVDRIHQRFQYIAGGLITILTLI